MSFQLKPFSDFLILKPIEEDRVTAMGLEIPDNAGKDKPRVGEVIAVGEDVTYCQIGDKVVYSPFTGETLVLQANAVDATELKVLREDALIALYIDTPPADENA